MGETLEQRKAGISDEVLSIQLKMGLQGVTEHRRLWVAYEPVWAIGVNGIPAAEEYVNERHRRLKRVLEELFGREKASVIPVLYGGSVNPGNVVPLISQPWVDGLFIGRSAWKAESFNRLIRMVLQSRTE